MQSIVHNVKVKKMDEVLKKGKSIKPDRTEIFEAPQTRNLPSNTIKTF